MSMVISFRLALKIHDRINHILLVKSENDVGLK